MSIFSGKKFWSKNPQKPAQKSADAPPRRTSESGGDSRPASTSHRPQPRRDDEVRTRPQRSPSRESSPFARPHQSLSPAQSRSEDSSFAKEHSKPAVKSAMRTAQVLDSVATFAELPLAEPLQRAIAESGYTQPTPIQQQAIPFLLQGQDLLGCAQTGTGKTAAFALPILHRLGESTKRPTPKHARVLILTPTRELAIQIDQSFKTYGKHMRVKSTVVYGGVGQGPQVRALQQGVDVLVATPGRLLDLIEQRHLSLSQLEVFVLDEADRMLDMGFLPSIRRVIKLLPTARQTLFFSATMPPDIEKLAATLLTNPSRVEVTPVSSTSEIIQQSVMFVEQSQKRELLRHLLRNKTLSRVIVFTRTKHGANRVSEFLAKSEVSSEAIHGNKSQSARQRALENFRTGQTRVLIATDIAARGIDIDNISHVINYELPNISESYVHRIGRTARAGAQGIAISFCDAEERAFLKDIEKLIGKSIPVVEDQPYHSMKVANARPMRPGKAKAAIEGRAPRERSRGDHFRAARGKTGAPPMRPKRQPLDV